MQTLVELMKVFRTSDHLSKAEIDSIETRLSSEPSDEISRAAALAYYTSIGDSKLFEHVAWIIEHVSGSDLCWLAMTRAAVVDLRRRTPNIYQNLKELWLKTLKAVATPSCANNASIFFEVNSELLEAINVLEEGLRKAPADKLLLDRLADLRKKA